jgi:AraC family transcriptional regulator of adaptative response / DNA-3-methyladenine glycosylase II
LAQTQRLLLAKQLLTDTSLRVVDVAFASGFASVRQFNRLFRESYRLNPLALRKTSRLHHAENEQGIVLNLGYRAPLAWTTLVDFLVGRSSDRAERRIDDRYVRTVKLGTHKGWIAAQTDIKKPLVHIQVSSSLLPVLPELQARLRRLFDLNANPVVIDKHLGKQPLFKQRIKLVPGLRVPGTMDGFALALRAILGQQITVKAASTLYSRFINAFGEHVDTPFAGLDRTTPLCSEVANATLQQLIDLGLTSKRAQTISLMARAAAEGSLALDATIDIAATRAQLQEIAGIGPWTADYIAMRALNDPDAFPHSDLGLLKAAQLDKPAKLLITAEAWRPWRAYAALHLWHQLNAVG